MNRKAKLKSLIERMVRREVKKQYHLLEEKIYRNDDIDGKTLELKFELPAYPMKAHDPKQPKKITIEAGEEIKVIEKYPINLAHDSIIEYDGQEWIVDRGGLESGLGMSFNDRPGSRRVGYI